MAYIEKRGNKWRAQIRRAGQRPLNQTFDSKREAQAWARSIEHRADKGESIVADKSLVDETIRFYRDEREKSGRPVAPQSNEHYLLRKLERSFSGKRFDRLSTQDIVDYARLRRRQGAGGYTINMELSKLSTVQRYTCALRGTPFNDVVAAARPLLHHFELISSQATRRERRPSPDEWARLLAYFSKYEEETQRPLPMLDIIAVASQVALRRGEIMRIEWADLDVERRVILVRDRKHPRKKKGNDERVPLVGNSLDIIMRQPRNAARIFPYNAQSISKLFTKACKELGIKDLRLHDMRHEATSALFEAGWEIPEVAAVTGHKDWRNLRRYTNLDLSTIAKKGV